MHCVLCEAGTVSCSFNSYLHYHLVTFLSHKVNIHYVWQRNEINYVHSREESCDIIVEIFPYTF